MSEFKNEVDALITLVDDPSLKKEVEVAKSYDPMITLKNNVLGFFTERLGNIKNREKLLDLIQKKIELKIESEDIELGELIMFFNTIANQIGIASADIIGLFKSVPGAPSPFVNDLSRKKELDSDVDDFVSNLPRGYLEKINKLYQQIENNNEDLN
ncbi:MAG: hypothetical protein GF311_28080 [Candidatus Lokiarchaeota archaeon]|nr:hypothetical protein [Candidatus Lokiarchaeota archaeon]